MKTLNFKFTGNKTQDSAIIRKIARLLKQGLIGVVPTDTLYGLVARAVDKRAVAKIYHLRHRKATKPLVVLISSVNDLVGFGIVPDKFTSKVLSELWPGKISVVLPCPNPELKYLHRGAESLAVRLPDSRMLRSLIKQTGPLVAPSANIQGCAPATSILEAKGYFSDRIDFYADAGKKESLPSTLVKTEKGKVIVLRKGAVEIK